MPSDPSDERRLEGLKEVWKVCRAREDEKNSLIKDLFRHIDNLSGRLSKVESELCNNRDAVEWNRDKFQKAESRIVTLERERARHTFVSVLIDGDDMLFRDDLVNQGQEGGKRTASLLQQAIKEELKSLDTPAGSNVRVIVRVYANKQGLAKIYNDVGILAGLRPFDDFVRGFNMGDVMCDYVDAGNGKECADEKVKANFRTHLENTHCHRIFFGGASDNGYARLLEPYKYLDDESIRARIVLLEGPPFSRELAGVKDQFRTVSFSHIFRSQKIISNRKASPHLTPPATPSADYATAAAKAPQPTVASASATQPSTASTGTALTPRIPRNKKGQRVDAPLKYSQQDFLNLKSRKLCNAHHLLGRCHYLEMRGKCEHDHAEKLSAKQRVALLAVARQSHCPVGLYCSDVNCLAGHRCTRDNCVPATCRFPKVMHNVDTCVVG